MTTRTNKATSALGAIAAALTLTFVAPAFAGEPSDIVVRSDAAMTNWQESTTADLNRSLARDPIARKVRPNKSYVEVSFTLGADGKADNIAVTGGNGNWAAKRSARYAVRTLDTLDEVPVANPQGARFLASIVFADNERDYREMSALASARRTARFASIAQEDRPILLGG